MKLNKILFQADYGLTLSIAQLEPDPFKRDAPEIAVIDRNGEIVTDYYDNHSKQLTGGGEVIEKATMLNLIILLRQIQSKGSPSIKYYEEKAEKNKKIETAILDNIDPKDPDAARLVEEATRPRVNKNGRPVYDRKPEPSDNWIENILKGTPLEITADDIWKLEQRKR